MNRSSLKVVYLLIALVGAARLLPHPENFAMVGALALFAGAYLPTRIAWLVPLGALLIGDAVIGFYNGVVMVGVYVGFAMSAMVGRAVLSQRRTTFRLGGSVLASALLFFLVSNFGVWLVAYPNTFAGLVSCYVNAIPFFGRSLLGDLIYSALLFGAYEGLKHYFTQQVPQQVASQKNANT